ncbi:sulfotransferase domain-containing protein [Rhizorhapis suberifaciens]|uniref:Sulfotransferase domain-containing protein n=1 Tax=Rhizorhapis suberifaciens TaxID=13656 RepID=A0A840HSW4_9SPHN|nr:sulfotransferase domain-containing protein [Rhizorhapis suberifaciens]MBB4640707.1 hypothetical protein [Rhizorhapis suberifaciens]
MSGLHILPQFIMIGAVKAATSWLAFQLRHNPALFLPPIEPHFFSVKFRQGFSWYSQFFREAGAGQLPGEKSTDYLAHPDAARRIAELLPDIPLIVQLRNPVDRAYSEYRMQLRHGLLKGPPEDHLTPSNASVPPILDDGLYFHHLKRWMNHFPRSQIKILLHDDIRERPVWVMEEVCAHLGVPFHFVEVRREKADEKVDEQSLHPHRLHHLWRPVHQAVRRLHGNRLFEAARSKLGRPPYCPPLSADLRAHLEEFYAPEVDRLGKLIRRDLSPWLPAARKAA